MLGGIYGDILKYDFAVLGRSIQLGAEFNFFLADEFTISAGYDLWWPNSNLVLGARYYPGEQIFIRGRGLLGSDDVAVGLGGWFPLGDRLRLELIADYYFLDGGDVALRAGVAYNFGRVF